MFTRILLSICVLGAIFITYKKLNTEPKISNRPPLINSNPITPALSKRSIASVNDRPYRHKRRKNSILIKLKDNASPAQIDALQELYQKMDLRNEKLLLAGKAIRLKVSQTTYDDQEEEIAKLIQQTGAVQFAEPDFAVQPALIPNDSLYSYQWHHSQIKSELAWDYSQGKSTVIVAVCDAGFDLAHPDLVSRFILPGYNTVKNNSQITNINDHGTMTSGMVAAVGNNSQGVAGMAWQVRILPIQISDQPDGVSTYSDVAECINYAKDHGAKVVNLSYDSAYTSDLVSEAAQAMRNVGGLVVVAAGNSTTDISAWGPSPQLIVVGASDPQDKLTWFSNFGTPVDLIAPGLDVYSTSAGGNYSIISGTSFSTPIVAGTVALLYSLNPNLTPTQIESFISSTLINVGLPTGRLNAGAALQKASQQNNPIESTITLDNLAAKASDISHIFRGTWCVSNQTGFFGNPSLNSCGRRLDTYRFIPSIPKAKAYNISIRYLSNSTLSRRVPIAIRSASGLVNKTINMQSGGGAWVSLGTFNLRAGLVNYLELSDANGTVNIDGVKFEPVVTPTKVAKILND